MEHRPPRIVSDAEEQALLKAADELYGYAMRAFVFVALNTGARRSELLRLTWARTDLDGADSRIHLDRTKSHRDRYVPIDQPVVAVLRRLQVQTLPDGGPFIRLADNLGRRWVSVVKKAGVTGVSIHDLRRTFITRLIRAGVELPTVQKLAGHADIKTTLSYYHWVSDADMRGGIAKLRKAAAG